jgi:polyhydroxyalkanoate synthase
MIPGLEETARVQRGLWLLETLPWPEVGLTPHVVVHRQDKLSVRHYDPLGDAVRKTPVVVIPSLINRAYIVDLEDDRSLVRGLTEAGHPVYLVDWGVPNSEDAEEDVGYVLLELLHRAIDRACRHARSRQCILLGYCQGGTLATMYAALRPKRIAALTTLNAPVHFAEGGRFRQMVDSEHFDVDEVITDGLLPVEVMKMGFKLLDPMGNWSKYLAIETASHDERKMQRVLARERWLADNVPMPAAFAREFIRNAYQEDRLMDGSWEIRGERVDLSTIMVPLLVVACERDFITPPAAAIPLAELVGSKDVTTEVMPTGHIGVIVGGAGPKLFYPLLDAWFRRVTELSAEGESR